ncbi:hypothetical protein [Brachybacterium sp. AOP35-5H-19]|uniref:hypothetical protein n=1 Tax=Brachybacterium sp. AOP35-5H-19 TaxID=3457685 RepID=UPI003FB9D3FC
MLPEDIADHLLDPDDEVLLALPGIPDDKPKIALVTTREVILGRWNTEGRTPADVREAVFEEGRFKDWVRVEMHDGSSLTLDGINPLEGQEFVDAFNTLIATGALPPELQPFH